MEERSSRTITMQDIERIVGRLFIESQVLREEVIRLEEELTRKGEIDAEQIRLAPQHSSGPREAGEVLQRSETGGRTSPRPG